MQSRVIITGEPLVINDVAERVQDRRAYYDVDREGTMRKLPDSGPPGTQAAMMVPVKHEGRVVGVVQVMSDQRAVLAGAARARRGARHADGAPPYATRACTRSAGLEVGRGGAGPSPPSASRRRACSRPSATASSSLTPRASSGSGTGRPCSSPGSRRGRRVGGRPSATRSRGGAAHGQIPVAERGAAPRAGHAAGRGRRARAVALVRRRAQRRRRRLRVPRPLERARLEEEKSDFIATVSHELRTPMAAIYGAAQTLLRDDVESHRRAAPQLLGMVATQAARLSQITEEVLLASRSTADGFPWGEPVDARRRDAQAVEAMRPQLARLPST